MSDTDDTDLTPMERLLESELNEFVPRNAKDEPCVMGQIVTRDGQMIPGPITRGPMPRMYCATQPAVINQRPDPSKRVQIYFMGTDIARLIILRDVEVPMIQAVGGGGDLIIPH